MATNSNVEDGLELVRGLGREIQKREIQKRVAIGVTGNAAGSAYTSSATSPPTALVQTLAACLFNANKYSPRTSKGVSSKRGYCQVSGGNAGPILRSPSDSVSSDSSGCAAGYWSTSSREIMDKNNAAPVRPIPSQAPAASVGSQIPMDLVGNGPQIPPVQAAGGEGEGRKANSPSMVGSKSGKNALTAPAAAGIGKPKKPRRARKSKKPPTTTINVPSIDFRATVQQLTGLESAATPPGPCECRPTAQKVEVVNPQGRVQATATAEVFSARPEQTFERDIATQSPPAGLDFSAISLPRTVRDPMTGEVKVLPRPPATFSYGEESTSGSDLNITMGFDHQQSFIHMACLDLPNQQVEDRLFGGPYSSDVRDAAGFPPESREPSSADASLATASTSSHPRVTTADTWEGNANHKEGVSLHEDAGNHVEQIDWVDSIWSLKQFCT